MNLPKPDARIAPTADEFDAWCQHPVTRYVAAAWQVAAARQREAWTEASWNPDADPAKLLVLRLELITRADAYSAFLETGLERYVELNTEDR